MGSGTHPATHLGGGRPPARDMEQKLGLTGAFYSTAQGSWAAFSCRSSGHAGPLPETFLLECLVATKPLGATGFQMAGWWSQRRAWVDLYRLVPHCDATGLGVTLLLSFLLPQHHFKATSAWLRGWPAAGSKQIIEGNTWPAAVGRGAPGPDHMPFLPMAAFPLLPSHLPFFPGGLC